MSVERRIHQRSPAVSRHFRAMPHGRGHAGENHMRWTEPLPRRPVGQTSNESDMRSSPVRGFRPVGRSCGPDAGRRRRPGPQSLAGRLLGIHRSRREVCMTGRTPVPVGSLGIQAHAARQAHHPKAGRDQLRSERAVLIAPFRESATPALPRGAYDGRERAMSTQDGDPYPSAIPTPPPATRLVRASASLSQRSA